MNRSLGGSLLSLALIAGTILPACATEREDPLASTLLLPVRVAALGTGIAVGTPIATVRSMADAYLQQQENVAHNILGGGNEPDPITSIVAGVAVLPTSAAVGLLQGLHEGTKNAVDNCMDKPFSLESFSLGDDK